jgi:hypothetical protein
MPIILTRTQRPLAKETSDLAMRHASDTLERYLKGNPKSLAIGSASVGKVGNIIHPGIGTLISKAFTGWEYLMDRKKRREIARAPFVVDALIEKHQVPIQ